MQKLHTLGAAASAAARTEDLRATRCIEGDFGENEWWRMQKGESALGDSRITSDNYSPFIHAPPKLLGLPRIQGAYHPLITSYNIELVAQWLSRHSRGMPSLVRLHHIQNIKYTQLIPLLYSSAAGSL